MHARCVISCWEKLFIGWRKPPIIISNTVGTHTCNIYTYILHTLLRERKCYFVTHLLSTYYRVSGPRRFYDAEARHVAIDRSHDRYYVLSWQPHVVTQICELRKLWDLSASLLLVYFSRRIHTYWFLCKYIIHGIYFIYLPISNNSPCQSMLVEQGYVSIDANCEIIKI